MCANSYQEIVCSPDSLDDECKELQDVMRAIHNCFHQAACSSPSCIETKRALNEAVLAWWKTLRPNLKAGMVL